LQYFLSAISQDYIKNDCKNSFWVPFVRSKKNSTNWIIHDELKSFDTEITFDPWKKKDLGISKLNFDAEKDCMIFDIFSKEYMEEECKDLEIFCSFCQIKDERRKIFNLKMNCEEQHIIDEKYFFTTDINLKFSGVFGLSNIIQNSTGDWMLDLLDEYSDSMNVIAVENATTFSTYPMGLLNYNSRLQFHQYVYEQLFLPKLQQAQKTVMSSLFFALLGFTPAKAACKNVGEIDLRLGCNFSDDCPKNIVSTKTLRLNNNTCSFLSHFNYLRYNALKQNLYRKQNAYKQNIIRGGKEKESLVN